MCMIILKFINDKNTNYDKKIEKYNIFYGIILNFNKTY